MVAHDARPELKPAREWQTMCPKLLGGSAGSTRQRTRFRNRARPVQRCTENGEMPRAQCVKERLEDHFRSKKEIFEVVVERIELFPTGGGFNAQASDNIVGILFKFRAKMFDGVRE